MKINLNLPSCLASTVWSSLVLTNISTMASCLSSGQSLTSLVLLLIHHRSAPLLSLLQKMLWWGVWH
jgi:hypothetical protein